VGIQTREVPISSSEFVASRERFDTDFWLIELDIAEPERFIAETTVRVDPLGTAGKPGQHRAGGTI
jgi:hypothetical protein